MPSTIADLFAAAELTYAGVVSWGARPPLATPGAYVVARSAAPDEPVVPTEAAISRAAVDRLLKVRPELRLDGRRPTPDELRLRLQRCWLPDEPVLYVGLASKSVAGRVSAYYRTPLGARRPHAGGWFLKTLDEVESLWVHFAPAPDAARAEDAMLRRFCGAVSEASQGRLIDPGRPFPFANLEWPRGTRKRHGITGATEPRGP